MLTDLLVAARGLRRSPAFTLAAVVTLALGIGANATMFSVVNSVLLRPLPGYQTDRLLEVCDNQRGHCSFLPPEVYVTLRARLHSFAILAANQNCRMHLTGMGEPEQLNGPCTTANWFDIQRAHAMLGRTFLLDEDRHGRNRVVVLDHAYWERKFGGDGAIIGRALVLDSQPWQVIGVMPRGYRPVETGPSPIYTAYVVADNPHNLHVVGRLKPAVSRAAAQAEVRVAADQLRRENPAWKDLAVVFGGLSYGPP